MSLLQKLRMHNLQSIYEDSTARKEVNTMQPTTSDECSVPFDHQLVFGYKPK